MNPLLCAANELRGDDSWGVTDGHKLYKHTGSILATYEDHNCDTPTFHTRGASVGTISERNAHPFEYISEAKGVTVVGVHNGHIVNNEELKARYIEHRKDFEVDSENIFAQLAEGLPTEDIHGYGAVVWYEYPNGRPKERRRYISTFSNPSMHIVRLNTGEVVFSSTIESIRIAARFAGVHITGAVKIVNKMKYELMPNGDVKSHGLMRWDERPPVVVNQHHSRRSHWGFDDRHNVTRNFPSGTTYSSCKAWSCSKQTSEDEVICPECIRKLLVEFVEPTRLPADGAIMLPGSVAVPTGGGLVVPIDIPRKVQA